MLLLKESDNVMLVMDKFVSMVRNFLVYKLANMLIF